MFICDLRRLETSNSTAQSFYEYKEWCRLRNDESIGSLMDESFNKVNATIHRMLPTNLTFRRIDDISSNLILGGGHLVCISHAPAYEVVAAGKRYSC